MRVYVINMLVEFIMGYFNMNLAVPESHNGLFKTDCNQPRMQQDVSCLI